MSVAQDLYEAGFITYMRTDSVTLSETAITAARNQVRQLFGAAYLPDKPRVYTSKVKNAQEAHEAIRPAGETFLTPAQTRLTGDQFRLYELVWMRTISSQMKDAEGLSVTIKINADRRQNAEACTFVASGRTITFYGFLKAYVESLDDAEGQSDDAQTRLPNLTQGQSLRPESVTASGHETRPPARYTEPSLVAKLEELEIGRPSTYATILRTITARDYVFKKGTALVPTWLAFAVTRLLEEHFSNLVDYAFTAEMEGVLDQIAGGNAERIAVLTEFYFGADRAERACIGWSPSSARSTPASSPPSRSATWSRPAPSRSWSGSAATAPTSKMIKGGGPTSPTICRPTSSPSRWPASC